MRRVEVRAHNLIGHESHEVLMRKSSVNQDGVDGEGTMARERGESLLNLVLVWDRVCATDFAPWNRVEGYPSVGCTVGWETIPVLSQLVNVRVLHNLRIVLATFGFAKARQSRSDFGQPLQSTIGRAIDGKLAMYGSWANSLMVFCERWYELVITAFA